MSHTNSYKTLSTRERVELQQRRNLEAAAFERGMTVDEYQTMTRTVAKLNECFGNNKPQQQQMSFGF